jgi:hypothetical protein
MAAGIGGEHVWFGSAVCQDLGKIVDRKADAAAPPPQCVDHFVAFNGAKPGAEGGPHPCSAA